MEVRSFVSKRQIWYTFTCLFSRDSDTAVVLDSQEEFKKCVCVKREREGAVLLE